MHIVLAAVMSADGKLTRGDDPHIHSWTSAEDAAHFSQLVADAKLIVMGRNTFEAVQPQPQPERLRMVLTSRPQDFAQQTVRGSLEFSDESPLTVTRRLEAQGYRDMLLVSGGTLSAAFLRAGLVNELCLTVEPVLFGAGVDLLDGVFSEASLQLLEIRQMNKRGTFLARYRVLYTVDRNAPAS